MVGLLGCGCCGGGGGGEPCPNNNAFDFVDDFSPDFDPYWPSTQNKFRLITRDGKCQVDGFRNPTQTGSYGHLFAQFRKQTKLGNLSIQCTLSNWSGLPRYTDIILVNKLPIGFVEIRLSAINRYLPPPLPPVSKEWKFSINDTIYWDSFSETQKQKTGDVFKIEAIDFAAVQVNGDPNLRYVAAAYFRVWINGVIRYVTPPFPSAAGVFDFCDIRAGLRIDETQSSTGAYVKLDEWTWESD